MVKYMVVYSQVDEDTKLSFQKVVFEEDKNDAFNTMTYVASVIGQEAQLYEWDNENRVYNFVCRIEPEHTTREEIDQ